MKLKESKFNLLYEDVYNRYQSGGLVSGDIVRFRANALSNPRVKEMTEEYKQYIRDLMESDLILKVGAVKQARPAMQYGMANTIFGYSADIVQEYAPGLFKNPITVPIELLERVETGPNRSSVPDSLKRKDTTQIKPEKADKVVKPRTLSTRTDTDIGGNFDRAGTS
jgi:hypothetical protein